jgi:hypothetical protein
MGALEGAGGDMRQMTHMAEKLELSETQKQDFMTLLEMYRPRFEALAKRGKEDRQALLEMAPDAKAYGDLTDQVSAEAGKSAAEVVTLLAELQGLVYALLTTEQQTRFLELRTEQQARMRDYREKHAAGAKGAHGKHGGKHGGGHHGGHKGKHCGGDCKHGDGEAGSCPHKDAQQESPLE